MNETPVPPAHHHLGLPLMAAPDRVVRQTNAIDTVERIGRHAANGVTRIDILEVALHTDSCEILRQALPQEARRYR